MSKVSVGQDLHAGTTYLGRSRMECQHCGMDGGINRRQRTAYPDDKMNWAILCDECQEEAHEYWNDMWNEYYQNCM